MIHSELKGKLPEIRDKEDALTSNVFGLIGLLPSFVLVKILNKAVNTEDKSFLIDENEIIKELELWKRYEYGEPDIFIETNECIGIIEAKYKSPKSGSASEDTNSKEIKNKEMDQLAKYWKCIEKSPKEKFIIFLTNDSSIPYNDIKISELASESKAKIYWLNWTTVHYELLNLKDKDDKKLNPTERKIIELLIKYLNYKGFVRFMGWTKLNCKSIKLERIYKGEIKMDNEVDVENIIKSVQCFESISKDIYLIYKDLQTELKKMYDKKTDILRENEWNYFPFEESQFILQYHYRVSDKEVKGFSIIISIPDKPHKTFDDYKICRDLNIANEQYPLLLSYGIFEPIDIEKYNAEDWFKLYMGFDNWHNDKLPEKFEFDKIHAIETNIPEESNAWFRRARFKIQPLLVVKSLKDIERIAKDIFEITL